MKFTVVLHIGQPDKIIVAEPAKIIVAEQFVHGYNNKFNEIADAYLKISNLLQTSDVKYDQLIGYIWPGGEYRLSYKSAKNRATELSPRIATFLEKICSAASEVNIIAHSLGCFLTLKAMKKLNKKLSEKIGNIYLMAPAVSNHALSKGADFSSALSLSKNNLHNFI